MGLHRVKGHPRGDPPFVHPQQVDALQRVGGMIEFVQELSGTRYVLLPPRVEGDWQQPERQLAG